MAINKPRITAKELKRIYGDKVLNLGYQGINLVREVPCFKSLGYNAGIYGWNFDAYEVEYNDDTYCVLVGYGNTFGRRVSYEALSYAEYVLWAELCNKYPHPTAIPEDELKEVTSQILDTLFNVKKDV